jgi:hypothetical protein
MHAPLAALAMDLSAPAEAPPPPLTWYVAYTAPRREWHTATALRLAGYSALALLLKKAPPVGVRPGACQPRYAALFPRYVFFARNGASCRSIADVHGVVKVLAVDGRWVAVPPHLLGPLLLKNAIGLHDEREPVRKQVRHRRRRARPRKIKRQMRALGQWLDGVNRAGQGA